MWGENVLKSHSLQKTLNAGHGKTSLQLLVRNVQETPCKDPAFALVASQNSKERAYC